MSKNNVDKVVNEVIDDVIANAQDLCKQAFSKAAGRALTELYNKALDLFGDKDGGNNGSGATYYGGYDPIRYKRTGQLKNSVVKHEKYSQTKSKLHGKIWIEYNPSLLHYVGGSKEKPLSVDSSWVLENVLEGVHINARSDRIRGNTPNHNEEIEKFKETLKGKLSDYVNDDLVGIIASKFIK